ncbi:MAG: dockerin type I repeat-containing protein [Candidatus Zixiibacteriota bacterium]
MTRDTIYTFHITLSYMQKYFWRVKALDTKMQSTLSNQTYILIFAGYRNGDANGDSVINVGDVVYLINYLFKSGPAPNPLAAGDATCNGIVDAGDVVYLINYLFKGGPSPCS